MTDTSKPPYPENWKSISRGIRDRARGRCECTGECGLHGPGKLSEDIKGGLHADPRRCIEQAGHPGIYARGRIMLTVHHLDHDPRNNQPANLKAMSRVDSRRCSELSWWEAGGAIRRLYDYDHPG